MPKGSERIMDRPRQRLAPVAAEVPARLADLILGLGDLVGAISSSAGGSGSYMWLTTSAENSGSFACPAM